MTRLLLAAAAAIVLVGCGGDGGRDARPDAPRKQSAPRGLASLVAARLPAGETPEAIAIGYGSLWVTNRYGGVTEVDPAGRRPPRRIAVDRLYGRSIATGAGSIWVYDADEAQPAVVERIDPETGGREGAIPVDYESQLPIRLVFADGYLWLYNGNDGNLYKVDPRTNSVVDRVKVSRRDEVIAVAVAGGAIWTASLAGRVTRVDPAAMEVTARVPDLTATVLAGDGDELWAAQLGGGLARIDPRTATVALRAPVGSGEEFRLALAGRTLWARSDLTLYALDVRTGKVRWSDRIPRAREVFGLTDGYGALWMVRGSLDEIWRLPLVPPRAKASSSPGATTS